LAVDSEKVAFLEWLDGFTHNLPAFDWDEYPAASTAILVIDLVRGFCHLGPLASPRVEALVEPAHAFLQEAKSRGMEHLLFCCDEHAPDSPEFQAFPPHCLKDTPESDIHPRLQGLGRRFAKGSLNSLLEEELLDYLKSHPQLCNFIVVGDCTDLCVYSAAMHLRMLANRSCLSHWKVQVLANLVDTYDLPLETATRLGILPHPAELCHQMALYQMALNGVKVSSIKINN
jgi:nicotinamidase-related amidase